MIGNKTPWSPLTLRKQTGSYPMADNTRMQEEMRALQDQIANLKDSLTAQGYSVADQVRDTASSALNGAARKVDGATRYARNEAASVAGIVREHPTATSTALLGMALVGGVLGYLLGSQTTEEPRRRWY
jgi:ElaB/YqjD/DUF883 family membrane-anchored ribosome-binding protein